MTDRKSPPSAPAGAPPKATGKGTRSVAVLSALYMAKVSALERAIKIARFPAPNVDRAIIIAGMAQLAEGDIAPSQRAAAGVLLDWCAPGWDRENPELCGILVGRRHDERYRYWRMSVLDRDGHSCQARGCGSRRKLHAHHIVRWVDSIALRFVVANGVTLCEDHHKRQHQNMAVRLWEN